MPDREYYDPREIRCYDPARLIELAWIAFDSDHAQIKQESALVNHDVVISEDSTKIHGITTALLQKDGLDPAQVFSAFLDDLKKYSPEKIVGHNVVFDVNIILSECHRGAHTQVIESLGKLEKQCTMRLAHSVGLASSKFIKLQALCELLGVEHKNAHRAAADAAMCARCYHKMLGVKTEDAREHA